MITCHCCFSKVWLGNSVVTSGLSSHWLKAFVVAFTEVMQLAFHALSVMAKGLY